MTHNFQPAVNMRSESALSVEDSIIGQFEKIVEQFRTNVALHDDTLRITYDVMNRRVNRIAHAILHEIKQGAHGISIALMFDHDVDSIIGMLAVLKAGKPYVPLAPWQPRQRSASILDSADPCVMVTNAQNIAFVTSLVEGMAQPVPVINVDQLPEALPDTNPILDHPVDLDSPFSIMHTSGSTGAPKAVSRTHRVMMEAFHRKINVQGFDESVRTLLYAAYTGGAARGVIMGTLMAGGTINIYDMKRLGITPLTKFMQERQITYLSLMASVFRRWLDTLDEPVALPHLRDVGIGGEPVMRSDIERIIQVLPSNIKIRVALATGEVNVICQHTIDRDNLFEGETVPVGYPVRDKKVRLLDDDGNPVSDGEVGEFVVSAPHIQPTYIFDDELSRRKFQPDPEDPSMLRYFTGDLGRIRPDGMYEFIGRKDSMVKVRGHQVITNDLEGILHEHPSIKEVAVKPIGMGSEDVRIAAYYALRPGIDADTVSTSVLRSWLAERVPDYMLPSYFVHLDTLPLTDTGKVNRPALPEPEHIRPDIDAQFVPPATSLEVQLVRIWEEVLGIAPVGIDDGFFDLGGHSLLASQVIFEIEQQLGLTIKLAALSQAPTIRRLALVLQDYQPDAPLSSLVPIQPDGTRQPLYCIHPRGGLVGLYYHLSRNLDADQPVYGLQAQGLDGLSEPHRTVAEMAAHYIKEIQSIQPEGPYHLAGFSLGGQIIHEMACQLEEQGELVGLIALLDARVPRTPTGRISKIVQLRWRVLQDAAANLWRAIDQTARIMIQHPINRWLPEISARRQQLQAAREEQAAAQAGTVDPFNQPQWTPERRVLWANRKAGETHTPRPYSGAVTFFRATQSARGHRPPESYWNALVTGGVTVIDIPGTHRSIMEEPGVRVLAEKLSAVLDQYPLQS